MQGRRLLCAGLRAWRLLSCVPSPPHAPGMRFLCSHAPPDAPDAGKMVAHAKRGAGPAAAQGKVIDAGTVDTGTVSGVGSVLADPLGVLSEPRRLPEDKLVHLLDHDTLLLQKRRVPTEPGLVLKAEKFYPDDVKALHSSVVTSEDSAIFTLLAAYPSADLATLVLRHFAREDRITNAFRVLHAMKRLGIPRTPALYRSLTFATCKFEDIDYAFFTLENMLSDGIVDPVSLRRVFDSTASSMDPRVMHVYAVVCEAVSPRLWTRLSLRTTVLLVDVLYTLGVRKSKRVRRGMMTFPYPFPTSTLVYNKYRAEGNLKNPFESDEFEAVPIPTRAEQELDDVVFEQQDRNIVAHRQNGTKPEGQLRLERMLLELGVPLTGLPADFGQGDLLPYAHSDYLSSGNELVLDSPAQRD